MSLEEAYNLQKQKRYEEANQILIQLSKRSNLDAKFLYAQNLYNGFGVEKNRSEAYDLFEQILKVNQNQQIITTYANLKFEDFDIFLPNVSDEERDSHLKRTFELYLYAIYSSSKHPFVLFNFGTCYETGYGTHADYEEAQRYYEEALKYSTRGFRNTKNRLHFHLGRLRLRNEKTFSEGVKNILYAVQNGFIPAYVYAARLYYEGKLIQKDDSRAFNLFSIAAKNGITEGQFYLAEMYEKGIEKVVDKNLNKAIELYFAVATVLSGKNEVIIESLPRIASLPENWTPIDQRAIEKLRTYRPELLKLIDNYQNCEPNEIECKNDFSYHKSEYKHFYICHDRPDSIFDRYICSNCMKKRYSDCCLIDCGIQPCYCGYLSALKK